MPWASSTPGKQIHASGSHNICQAFADWRLAALSQRVNAFIGQVEMSRVGRTLPAI